MAVDLRKKSKTYGLFETILLSDKNKNKLFIPKGFAHGHMFWWTAIVSYKVDNYYKPSHEGGILWNDKSLEIDWKIDSKEIVISEKDKNLSPLTKLLIHFNEDFSTGENGQLVLK